MSSNDDLTSFSLNQEEKFEDVGVAFPGHVASSRGVQLTAVEGTHTQANAHEMTSMSWAFHAFITPPEGTFRIDGGRERRPWQTAFFPPGVSVNWRASPCTVGICHFNREFIAHLLESERGLGFDAIGCLFTKGSDRLSYLGQEVFREALSPGFAPALFAEAIGMQIALEVARNDQAFRPADDVLRGGLACWQKHRLESYVYEHLSKDLSLHDLADLLNMSIRHLSRVVRKDYGVSAFRWISDLRISETRRLLIHTNLPISDISQRVGFKSPSSFSTAFRAATGLRPSEFRQLFLRGSFGTF